MKHVLALVVVLSCGVSGTQSCALARPHEFEGVWIWDRAQYVPPPGMTALSHMTEETMSVSRDDGSHYTAHMRQVFDDGSVVILDEDVAEDGLDHPIGAATPPLLVRIEALPDGGRHVVSGREGDRHDSRCHVSEAGRTLTCRGTHTTADGSSGDYICVYRRDTHVITISHLVSDHARAVG